MFYVFIFLLGVRILEFKEVEVSSSSREHFILGRTKWGQGEQGERVGVESARELRASSTPSDCQAESLRKQLVGGVTEHQPEKVVGHM